MKTLTILEKLEGNAKAYFKQHLAVKEALIDTIEYEAIKADNQSYQSKVFYKGLFDKLDNPFDYDIFRYKVLNDSTYKRELNQTAFAFSAKGNKWNSNYELSYHIIHIFNVYCGFVAEAIIKAELEELGLKVKASTYLDTKKKTDILVNNKLYIQMKNISFLENSNSESRLSTYKPFDYLRFLFYKVSENAIINIYKVDNEVLPQILTLNGFSAVGAEVVPYEEAIEQIKLLA